MSNMPVIDLSQTSLQGRDLEIAQHCLNKDKLRATKPDRKKDGEAAWVWRMVAFSISIKRQHHCMPVMADFDLPDEFWPARTKGVGFDDPTWAQKSREAREKRVARKKELQAIADTMIETVPKQGWHGVNRWAHALGHY